MRDPARLVVADPEAQAVPRVDAHTLHAAALEAATNIAETIVDLVHL